MNNNIRQKLIEIINQYGTSLIDSPRRCEGLLKDLAGGTGMEINILILGLRSGIPAELLSPSSSLEYLIPRLVSRLEHDYGMKKEIARWSVDSWALALGVVSEAPVFTDRGDALPPPVETPAGIEGTCHQMNNNIRQTLIEIVNQHGTSLIQSPRRCEGLLKDLVGGDGLEINILILGLRSGIPAELLSSSSSLEYLIPRLVSRLEHDYGMKKEIARWSVDSWALALGVVSEAPVFSVTDRGDALPPPVETPAGPAKEITKHGIDLVFVKGGRFEMGDLWGDGAGDESPVHRVELDGFYMGKYEVTNAQYAQFLNEYGSDRVKEGEYQGKKMIYKHKRGVQKDGNQWQPAKGYANHPVVNVTWYGAYEFCRYYGFQLPTEAQWEYAARSGGKKEKWSGTSDENELTNYAWYSKNSDRKTHPVGKKQANGLGLYDLSGNVWEWCLDWYDKGYYKGLANKISKNPVNTNKSSGRVLRGGSWPDTPGPAGLRLAPGSIQCIGTTAPGSVWCVLLLCPKLLNLPSALLRFCPAQQGRDFFFGMFFAKTTWILFKKDLTP